MKDDKKEKEQKKTEDREKRTERFTWLKTKIFLLMVGTLIVAVIVLYMLYEHVIFGNFGNLVVGFLQEKFFLDFMDARTIYQYTFREHWGLLVFLGMVVIFLLISWFVLMRIIIGYFKKIDKAMDVMLSEDKWDVELPQELRTME